MEIMQDLDWQVPDWIVLPGGNLGNNTAIAKGLLELHELGIINQLPRIAVVQAAGANPSIPLGQKEQKFNLLRQKRLQPQSRLAIQFHGVNQCVELPH